MNKTYNVLPDMNWGINVDNLSYFFKNHGCECGVFCDLRDAPPFILLLNYVLALNLSLWTRCVFLAGIRHLHTQLQKPNGLTLFIHYLFGVFCSEDAWCKE